jgi:hypothetical protein
MTEEVSTTERLMNALISKMEAMDSDVQALKTENANLRKALRDPSAMLRKAGFVSATTPLSEDVPHDPFRADSSALLKGEQGGFPSNAEIHQMSWDDIHEMAEQARSVEVLP